MKSVTISLHSLRVKNNKDGDYFDLRKLPQRHTLYSLLDQYLESLKNQVPKEDANHVLLAVSEVRKTPRSIAACLERGEYGIESKLIHIKDNVVAHKRSVFEAEMMPLFFLAAIPADGKMGIAAFQMESNAGVRTRFKHDFEDYLRSKCGDVDLEIEYIVPKHLIQDFIRREKVTRVRFAGIKVPRSITQVFQGDNIGKNTTIELQVKVKHGSNLLLANGIEDLLNGRKTVNEFVQVRGFHFDTVKAEFEVGGKQRTVDFTDIGNFHADFDVTKNIKSEYPTFKDIHLAARELVIEIMESLGLDTSGV